MPQGAPAEDGYRAFECHGGDEWARLRLFDAAYDTLTHTELGKVAEPPRRVLELGPGTGSILQEVSRRWPDAELWAVGRDRATALLIPAGCEWIEHDLEQPLPLTQAFDLVIARSVLHLLDRRSKAIPELCEHLSRGGHILIQTIDLGPLVQRGGDSTIWQALLLLSRRSGIETNWLAALASVVEECGLSVVSAHHDMPFDHQDGPAARCWDMTITQAVPVLRKSIGKERLQSMLDAPRERGWRPYPGLTSVLGRRGN